MLPSQFTLQEEGHVPHYAVTGKNDIFDTLPETRHRQRLERPAGLRVGACYRSRLAVGRKKRFITACWSSVLAPEYGLLRRDPARRGAGIILDIFEGLLRLYR